LFDTSGGPESVWSSDVAARFVYQSQSDTLTSRRANAGLLATLFDTTCLPRPHALVSAASDTSLRIFCRLRDELGFSTELLVDVAGLSRVPLAWCTLDCLSSENALEHIGASPLLSADGDDAWSHTGLTGAVSHLKLVVRLLDYCPEKLRALTLATKKIAEDRDARECPFDLAVITDGNNHVFEADLTCGTLLPHSESQLGGLRVIIYCNDSSRGSSSVVPPAALNCIDDVLATDHFSLRASEPASMQWESGQDLPPIVQWCNPLSPNAGNVETRNMNNFDRDAGCLGLTPEGFDELLAWKVAQPGSAIPGLAPLGEVEAVANAIRLALLKGVHRAWLSRCTKMDAWTKTIMSSSSPGKHYS
jgi:hypothetical protein